MTAPTDEAALLVDSYLANGRYRDAVPLIEKAIAWFGADRGPEVARWHHRLGRVREALGENKAALAEYDTAFKIDMTPVATLRDYALLSYTTGELDRAQRLFRALLLQRRDATSGISQADAYYYLGDILRQNNDPPKAIHMLERALKADASHPKATALLAQLKRA